MKKKLIIFTLLIFSVNGFAQNLTAKAIVIKSDNLQRGKSNKSQMTMRIVRPKWTRTISMKTWSKGREFSMTYITAPAKEKGQVFMKRHNEMWNWVPSINRMIKLPPSMMSQGWMGSDYSNDDILKESSIVVDYNQKIIGSDKISNLDCYKIELIPKEDAAVTWGKVIKWISKKEFWQMKTEYYDEDNELLRTEIASEIKNFGDRRLPSKIEIIPADKPGHKTLIIINSATFNLNISENFFSQQNMKRIR